MMIWVFILICPIQSEGSPSRGDPDYVEGCEYAREVQEDGIIWKDILTDNLDKNSLINEGKLLTKWGTHEFAHSNRPWVEEGAYWDYTEIYSEQTGMQTVHRLQMQWQSQQPVRSRENIDVLKYA